MIQRSILPTALSKVLAFHVKTVLFQHKYNYLHGALDTVPHFGPKFGSPLCNTPALPDSVLLSACQARIVCVF